MPETTQTAEAATAGALHSLLVEFESVDALKAAARRVRDAGYSKWDVHSPFPVHGMDEAMGVRHTRLPWLVFGLGVVGAIVGLTMQWWMNATDPDDFKFVPSFLRGYDFRISGKPLWSLPANIPIIFEVTVLLSALGAVIGMLAMNNLPQWYHALFTSRRFQRVTSDRFFICVEAADPLFDERDTQKFLAGLGGTSLEPVNAPPTPARPQWFPMAALILFCLALLPPVWVYKATVSKTTEPRIHLIPNMDNQERFKAQQAHPLFADGRAMRPATDGTIARGDEWALGTDPHYYEGRTGDDWATAFPPQLEISEPLMLRGQEQFGTYCAVCHGLDGGGNGIVAQRAREKTQISTGWVPPSSLHDATIRERTVGHLFNTITNGIRTMPAYSDQISPGDRWSIIAYIRALQRSQNATIEDVPADRRSQLR
jgi:mono/diheme cytochrome c family protein